jgi:hypothetical protein
MTIWTGKSAWRVSERAACQSMSSAFKKECLDPLTIAGWISSRTVFPSQCKQKRKLESEPSRAGGVRADHAEGISRGNRIAKRRCRAVTPERRAGGVGRTHPSCGSVTTLESAEIMTDFSDVRIFLCTTPISMSWSFDRLMGRAQEVFDQDPTSGHLSIGRKNWLFLGSEAAGPRAAVLYTILAGARINQRGERFTESVIYPSHCGTSRNATPNRTGARAEARRSRDGRHTPARGIASGFACVRNPIPFSGIGLPRRFGPKWLAACPRFPAFSDIDAVQCYWGVPPDSEPPLHTQLAAHLLSRLKRSENWRCQPGRRRISNGVSR